MLDPMTREGGCHFRDRVVVGFIPISAICISSLKL